MADIFALKPEAIHRVRKEVVLANGTVLPFSSMHAADGTELDELDENGFVTIQLPNGRWMALHLSDYPIVEMQ